VAATIAVGILLAPDMKRSSAPSAPPAATARSLNTFEAGGETFIALPDADQDTPITEFRVVEMRVPISSLADAGVRVKPIANETSRTENAVLADVLLGVDGQPVGVHILDAE
jgi:hypothetical protein